MRFDLPPSAQEVCASCTPLLSGRLGRLLSGRLSLKEDSPVGKAFWRVALTCSQFSTGASLVQPLIITFLRHSGHTPFSSPWHLVTVATFHFRHRCHMKMNNIWHVGRILRNKGVCLTSRNAEEIIQMAGCPLWPPTLDVCMCDLLIG